MLKVSFLYSLSVSLLSAQGIGLNLTGDVENAPLHFVIEIVRAENRIPVMRGFGSTDGHFNIGPLDPGRYEVRIATETGDTLRSEYVELHQATAPLLIRLRPRETGARPISGIVSMRDLTKERRSAIKLLREAVRLREKSDMPGALNRYERAAAIDPSYALAHHELAVHYMALRRPSDARRELLKTVELDAKFQAAYTNLSIADITLGDPIGAEQAASRAIDLNHEDPKAGYMRDLARWLQRKGPKPALYANSSIR